MDVLLWEVAAAATFLPGTLNNRVMAKIIIIFLPPTRNKETINERRRREKNARYVETGSGIQNVDG